MKYVCVLAIDIYPRCNEKGIDNGRDKARLGSTFTTTVVAKLYSLADCACRDTYLRFVGALVTVTE